MNKKKILCLHHTDLDGAGSAAIVGLAHQGDSVKYKLFNYGWPLLPEDLKGYDLIYAVDISFHQDHPWVYDLPNLIWIDHHKTAIEYEEDNPELHQIPGIRRIGKGACELTWEYFYPDYDCPNLIQILSTYDVWDKKRMNWRMVEEIEIGAKYVFGIRPLEILRFIQEGRTTEELQEKGHILLDYLEGSGKGKLINGGFYIPNFYGYRVMALNTPDFSSLSFISCYNQKYIDIMMPFQIVPDLEHLGEFFVRVSLYSENPEIDVSEIAKRYGGGGHKGASGFSISLDVLIQIISTGVSLKSYFSSINYKP